VCLKKYDTKNLLWRNVIIYIKFGEIYSIFIEFEEICTINFKEKRSGNPATQNADKKKEKRKKSTLQKTRKIWATVYAEFEEMYYNKCWIKDIC
jgi:hypothetical protein